MRGTRSKAEHIIAILKEAKELTISIYQELIEQYPDCQVANIARTQLLRLGAELP